MGSQIESAGSASIDQFTLQLLESVNVELALHPRWIVVKWTRKYVQRAT